MSRSDSDSEGEAVSLFSSSARLLIEKKNSEDNAKEQTEGDVKDNDGRSDDSGRLGAGEREGNDREDDGSDEGRLPPFLLAAPAMLVARPKKVALEARPKKIARHAVPSSAPVLVDSPNIVAPRRAPAPCAESSLRTQSSATSCQTPRIVPPREIENRPISRPITLEVLVPDEAMLYVVDRHGTRKLNCRDSPIDPPDEGMKFRGYVLKEEGAFAFFVREGFEGQRGTRLPNKPAGRGQQHRVYGMTDPQL
jgi:hypothetical protein